MEDFCVINIFWLKKAANHWRMDDKNQDRRLVSGR